MASAMTSTTIFTVALIVETVVDPVSTKKIVQDVNAKQEALRTSRIHYLEMAIAMMNLTPQTAAMMAVTAVDKMLILNFAQTVNAKSRRHAPLDIIAHWWVTVIAMMNSTIQTASLMAWTAADLLSTPTSVLSALA